jgi:hypothetical protein
MVNRLVELQRPWTDRVEELRALGLPDWRAPALRAAIADVGKPKNVILVAFRSSAFLHSQGQERT